MLLVVECFQDDNQKDEEYQHYTYSRSVSSYNSTHANSSLLRRVIPKLQAEMGGRSVKDKAGWLSVILILFKVSGSGIDICHCIDNLGA